MPQIDPYDDSKVRYVIRRHQFDPETKHFRWLYEKAFDNKKEFDKAFVETSEELAVRQAKGVAHPKEQISGVTLEIGHFTNSNQRRSARQESGSYISSHPVNRVRVSLASLRHRLRWFL